MKAGHITIRRLRALNKLLRAIPDPQAKMPDRTSKFCMLRYTHPCGSPSCQLGWWAVSCGRYNEGTLSWVPYSYIAYTEFPGLSENLRNELFGAGTVQANYFGTVPSDLTPEQVAQYNELIIEELLATG